MLKEQIQEELKLLGLNAIQHPIFYNCTYGIRFEIGVGEVYDKDMSPRKEYLENALCRAVTVYNKGIQSPSILVWEVYSQNTDEKNNYKMLFTEKIAPILPHEESSQEIDEGAITQTLFYWDLKKITLPITKVFEEIIHGDLGGLQEFVSSVYLFDNQSHVMLHLYDDRGLDVVACDKSSLIFLYHPLS